MLCLVCGTRSPRVSLSSPFPFLFFFFFPTVCLLIKSETWSKSKRNDVGEIITPFDSAALVLSKSRKKSRYRHFSVKQFSGTLDPVYMMPVEFENGIKNAVLASRLYDAGVAVKKRKVCNSAVFKFRRHRVNALCQQNFMPLSSQD